MSERKKLYALSGALVAICALFFILNAISSKKSSDFSKEERSNEQNKQQIEQKNKETSESESKKDEDAPKSAFLIPKAKNGATIALILDDAGQNTEFLSRYTSLPFPFAVSVLPELPHTKECAALVRKSGKELMLHQPMQSENLSLYPGPGSIQPEMTTSEIAAIIEKNLENLGGGVRGMNNHEGSLITANAVKMGAVLELCKKRGIYFLDSRTTTQSAASAVSLEMDIPILERNAPYIDNEIDREKMLSRIYETLNFANAHGQAIVIAHVDKSANILPALLLELYPHLIQNGYRFTTPSTLLKKTAE